jgi:hypothetical protein
VIEAARKLVAKYAEEAKAERSKERAAIDDAVRTKVNLGESYWKHRHAAETRLRAARALVEALS